MTIETTICVCERMYVERMYVERMYCVCDIYVYVVEIWYIVVPVLV